MKVMTLLLVGLLAASCSQGLESVADTNRQARIDAANMNRPLSSGMGDGLGQNAAANENAVAQSEGGVGIVKDSH